MGVIRTGGGKYVDVIYEDSDFRVEFEARLENGGFIYAVGRIADSEIDLTAFLDDGPVAEGFIAFIEAVNEQRGSGPTIG